jgi:hypothetical protein
MYYKMYRLAASNKEPLGRVVARFLLLG